MRGRFGEGAIRCGGDSVRGRFGAGRFGGGDLVGGNLVLYRLIDVQYSPNELDPGSKTLFLSFLEDPVQGLCILL